MKIIVLIFWLGPKIVKNSLWSVELILAQINDHRDGEAQNKYGINKNPRIVEAQFIGKSISLEEGSKTENSLVIIFKFF